MTAPDQDRLTELFAHTVVLERRAAALLLFLGQDSMSLDAIRDEGHKLYNQVSMVAQLVYALTNVDPDLMLTQSDYQPVVRSPGA